MADIELTASQATFHVNNGDRSSAGSFHKTLPHDNLGQVRSRRGGEALRFVRFVFLLLKEAYRV